MQGVSGNELKKEVNQLLKDIQLQNKEKVIASSLSGGMKRKLRLVHLQSVFSTLGSRKCNVLKHF